MQLTKSRVATGYRVYWCNWLACENDMCSAATGQPQQLDAFKAAGLLYSCWVRLVPLLFDVTSSDSHTFLRLLSSTKWSNSVSDIGSSLRFEMQNSIMPTLRMVRLIKNHCFRWKTRAIAKKCIISYNSYSTQGKMYTLWRMQRAWSHQGKT